jgi:hypothetical protein
MSTGEFIIDSFLQRICECEVLWEDSLDIYEELVFQMDWHASNDQCQNVIHVIV